MVKTAVLVSGGGINLQALLDAYTFGEIPQCDLAAVISTSPECYAMRRAEMAGIPAYVVEREIFPNSSVFNYAITDKLRDLDIELVVLAGYNCEITEPFFRRFGGKIINTHPSLMPAFTDVELSDIELQEKVLASGVKLTGATAYFETETPRSGPIILQKAVDVNAEDTVATLRRRILEHGENAILPHAVGLYCDGRLTVQDGIVHISKPVPRPSDDETAE